MYLYILALAGSHLLFNITGNSLASFQKKKDLAASADWCALTIDVPFLVGRYGYCIAWAFVVGYFCFLSSLLAATFLFLFTCGSTV
jgi:hypothetical protein